MIWYLEPSFRNMVNWKWYREPCTNALFMHLLLIANRKDNIVDGISVKTGSVLITLQDLSSGSGVPKKHIKSSLEKLLSTNDISITDLHEKGNIITIVEWDKYTFAH
ncbi:MAG: hypothetical protein IJU61_09840 [Victivallales bacterium]|nr:hypothetical protein [Victivallales bacterium]